MPSSSLRKWTVIILTDFLLVLAVLFFARLFINLPRWYYLIAAAAGWVLMGVVSGKLNFTAYRYKSYAIYVTLLIDIISTFIIYGSFLIWLPGAVFRWTHLLIIAALFTIEILFCIFFRKFSGQKREFFYEIEPIGAEAEHGSEDATKYDPAEGTRDLTYMIDNIRDKNKYEAQKWIEEHKDEFSKGTVVLTDADHKCVYKYATANPILFIILQPFSSYRHLNTFLANINLVLPKGGYIAGHCLTAGLKQEQIRKGTPSVISGVYIFFDYMWHRVFPKVPFLKWIYFSLTKGVNREFTRVELLGRMYMAGFEVVDDDIRVGEFYIAARKVSAPLSVRPNTNILIRLRRIGKGGGEFGVYKFRTMHSYSEYIQGYVYQHNNLCKGGKMADDYRITVWGKFLRKTWLDELPMIINVIKGNMKLVGVRPLSRHYFSLYTPEMQELRIKTKPGLIPPFYSEEVIPESLEDVQANEKRYIEAYLKAPFKTDWKYFWGAMRNIILKGAKSK